MPSWPDSAEQDLAFLHEAYSAQNAEFRQPNVIHLKRDEMAWPSPPDAGREIFGNDGSQISLLADNRRRQRHCECVALRRSKYRPRQHCFTPVRDDSP